MEDDIPRLPRKTRGENDPKMIGLWKVGRTIGKGSSGRVRIARHSKTGIYAAVKIVSKNVLTNSVNRLADSAEHMLLSVEREIVIMKLIDHPNIMRLYDVWETSTELYLVLEYVEGGELFDYLCNKGRLSTSEALSYFQQIICAVDYCHRFNIAHRDLKPENLLMDKEKNIKVADFGMAAWQASRTNGLLQTACGSPHYAAPEVIMGKEYDGRSSDIWSCGVILFALLAGRLPFDDEDLSTLLDKVKSGKFDMPSGIDPMAKDLILKMLHKDAEQRITMHQILKHPFFSSQQPKATNQNMPDLDAIARPIGREEGIDPDIFANLRTLWHGTPDQEIIQSLRSDRANWQKGVYRLLTEYRNKRLENNDEEEDLITRARKGKRAMSCKAEPPKAMRRTTSEATDLGRSPSMLPPRAPPPTPRRARKYLDHDYLKPSTPQITLHSPSPPCPGATTYSPPTSQLSVPHSPFSPMMDSPNLPAITVPEVKDDKMQQFFQQIVEHLNAMEMRTNMAAGTPQMRSSPHVLQTSAPPSTPVDPGFSKQRQYAYDTRSGPHSPSGTRHRISATMEDANARITRQGLFSYPGEFGEFDKENNYLGVNVPGIVKKSSLRSNGTNSRRPPLRVQIIEPSPGKLRRKKSLETPTISSAFSDSSFSPPSTPRSWLGNVFKFKPTSYYLPSIHDGFTSCEECRRLLVSLGLKVVSTDTEEAGVLKCKFDEVKDPSSVLTLARSVRFRVEVHQPTMQQAMAGARVVLHLIQEKGASSSFQAIFRRLRRVWELDVPRMSMDGHSPMLSPAFTEGRGFTETLVYPD
ncbi:Pkinase-domain-containing protein [Phlebopus sp. FC_14]|nr:Pkinase-domain-containing protein [Phlebopus sp. FC_14]